MTNVPMVFTQLKHELYKIVDSFLVEAKDQNGNDRSLKQLNQDRHLAVEQLEKVIASAVKEERERIQKLVACGDCGGTGKDDYLGGASECGTCGGDGHTIYGWDGVKLSDLLKEEENHDK